MAGKFKWLAICLVLGLLGCTSTGPQKTLDEIAEALNQNNASAFLARIDMRAYAYNHIKSMTQNDEALSSLNALGNLLGLGGIDQLINSVMDMKSRMSQEFERGVSSGELVGECRRSETAGCPWIPQSLRNASIVKLDDNSAIARVTTPSKLSSWLALSRIDGMWMIVGQAIMESDARTFALAGAKVDKAIQQPVKSGPAVNI